MAKSKRPRKPFRYKPIPGLGEDTPIMTLEELAEIEQGYTNSTINGAVKAIIAKLAVERQVYIKGFGRFTVFHSDEPYLFNHLHHYTGIVFAPDEELILKLEKADVSF